MTDLKYALLTTSQMYLADTAAIGLGVASRTLMENAGQACAREIMARYAPCATAVLAGPGNNGGDGFVTARHLAANGWPVTVWLLGKSEAMTGDAKKMAGLWTGKTRKLTKSALEGADLVVDALFGAGLSRPLDGVPAVLARQSADRHVKIVAIDVPSGVEGTTGAVRGAVFAAELTITFFRKKPAHVCLPARKFCGDIVVADIGIPGNVLADINPQAFENSPAHWWPAWPVLDPNSHKYARGGLVVWGGPAHQTGAARLAAYAGLRVGAGAVTLCCAPDAVSVNAAHLTSIMIQPVESARGFEAFIADKRVSALILGPGMGVGTQTRRLVRVGLASGKPCILDADALTSFADQPDELFAAIEAQPERDVILTPHHGEFARLFPEFADHVGGKIEAARAAAALSGAFIVFKGSNSVIAAPDNRTIINTNAPPSLATAGAGDVLAGFIGGLLAQGMPGFEAACAGVWLHGAAATEFGAGLIADDLADCLPAVVTRLEAGPS